MIMTSERGEQVTNTLAQRETYERLLRDHPPDEYDLVRARNLMAQELKSGSIMAFMDGKQIKRISCRAGVFEQHDINRLLQQTGRAHIHLTAPLKLDGIYFGMPSVEVRCEVNCSCGKSHFFRLFVSHFTNNDIQAIKEVDE